MSTEIRLHLAVRCPYRYSMYGGITTKNSAEISVQGWQWLTDPDSRCGTHIYIHLELLHLMFLSFRYLDHIIAITFWLEPQNIE